MSSSLITVSSFSMGVWLPSDIVVVWTMQVADLQPRKGWTFVKQKYYIHFIRKNMGSSLIRYDTILFFSSALFPSYRTVMENARLSYFCSIGAASGSLFLSSSRTSSWGGSHSGGWDYLTDSSGWGTSLSLSAWVTGAGDGTGSELIKLLMDRSGFNCGVFSGLLCGEVCGMGTDLKMGSSGRPNRLLGLEALSADAETCESAICEE